MKIFGIGTDIVSIDRIKKSIKNKKFVNRVYNIKEISKCKKLINSGHCFAKRFAAKEAFSKALGTGISNGINLNEIIVKNNISGKPYFNFEGDTKKLLKKKFKNKVIKTSLSLSDENKYAVAFVTISL
jgi:holo-[acyl-carrier protein] synthase